MRMMTRTLLNWLRKISRGVVFFSSFNSLGP